MPPVAIDLFCGLGGWTEGLLAAGCEVVGFDIENHRYGDHAYPAQLVLQDVRTIDGARFKDAALIVASPPCQEYSYMAMPWSRAKAMRREYLDGKRDRAKLTELFDACFRIQREACAAAGRHIPMVVENVRGAQEWVGRARWHYGSYYLWGDVPAVMLLTPKRPSKNKGGSWFNIGSPGQKVMGQNPVTGYKSEGLNWSDRSKKGQDFTRVAGARAVKCGGGWFGKGNDKSLMRQFTSKSPKRKAASALIAKIPFELARYIAEVYAQ